MGANLDNIFLNACKNGQKGVVETFVKKGGINYNKRDENGNTPLYYAAQKGARDIVKLLIENGADATIANNQSITPLHAVSKTGNKEIITILTENGADVNATDKEGKTPLIYAVSAGKSEISRQLLTLARTKQLRITTITTLWIMPRPAVFATLSRF
jgi:FOG: Ankyrin repeat